MTAATNRYKHKFPTKDKRSQNYLMKNSNNSIDLVWCTRRRPFPSRRLRCLSHWRYNFSIFGTKNSIQTDDETTVDVDSSLDKIEPQKTSVHRKRILMCIFSAGKRATAKYYGVKWSEQNGNE